MGAPHSLRLRIGLSVVLIAAISLFEMVVSLSISELAHGEAQAINIAGTVRMQTYRLIATLQDPNRPQNPENGLRDAAALDASLHDARLTANLRYNLSSAPKRRYAALLHEWRVALKPLLAQDRQSASSQNGSALLRAAPAFVSRANALVESLQNDTDRKINLLRASQILGLITILVAFYVTVSAARREVGGPLNELLAVAAKVSAGDFSYRIAPRGDDELMQLAQAINSMSEALSRHYADMEGQIEARTRELQQRNQSLELLYDVSKCLSEDPYNIASYQQVLRKTEAVMGLRGAALCTMRENTEGAAMLASDITGTPPYFCGDSACRECLGNGETHIWHSGQAPQSDDLTLSVPLVNGDVGAGGVLSLSIPSGVPMEPWQIQTIETVGRHIGIALEATRRNAQQRRIGLLEERNAIARDLHDSLAQSLSYLKIQVARLRAHRSQDQEAIDAVINDIGEGLSAAYRQLRELLATFRLQMPKGGLESALTATVTEFADRTGIPIKLSDHLSHALLDSNEEIDILHITREALANIEHHAQAQHAWVWLALKNQNEAVIRIEDDGIGIGLGDTYAGHYGLAIMRERALSIRGSIRVRRRRRHGTQVELRFVPSAYRTATLNLEVDALKEGRDCD